EPASVADVGNDSPRIDSTVAVAISRRQRRTTTDLVTQPLARSLRDAVGPGHGAIHLFRGDSDLHRYPATPADADANDHYLRIPSGDVRIDAIVHERRHKSLLVSPTDAEHRFRSFHQSSPFCGLHGIDAGAAVGTLVFGFDRSAQATAL